MKWHLGEAAARSERDATTWPEPSGSSLVETYP